jgi:RNase P/RNase MRP subunit POP5
MMRDKRRYILVACTKKISDGERKEFERALHSELIRQIGEMEYFMANPKIMKFVGEDSFIIRTGLRKYGSMIVALALTKNVGGRDMGLHTLRSSGTIRALEKEKIL